MAKFFCAEASRLAGEDMIGSAIYYQTYVLIECPMPWTGDAFDSPQIPAALREFVQAVKQSGRSVRFLLITQGKRLQADPLKLVIYQQQPVLSQRSLSQEQLSQGYVGWEWSVETLDQTIEIIRQHLDAPASAQHRISSQMRDILVCTHGSHDMCCAKYGLPFYRQAIATLSELQMNHVRLWKVSHFGGHRFAPTIIHFPDGRYYGSLDQETFRSIVTCAGDIQCFNQIYRGWNRLPLPLQVLERELILCYGWDWLKYRATHHILEQNSDGSRIQAQILFERLDGSLHICEAEIVQDDSATRYLKGSCHALQEAKFIKYAIKSLRIYPQMNLSGGMQSPRSNSYPHQAISEKLQPHQQWAR